MEEKSLSVDNALPDEDLPNTTCRFSKQHAGFTVYIGVDIADKVLKVLKLHKTHIAVFDSEKEQLIIQKLKVLL